MISSIEQSMQAAEDLRDRTIDFFHQNMTEMADSDLLPLDVACSVMCHTLVYLGLSSIISACSDPKDSSTYFFNEIKEAAELAVEAAKTIKKDAVTFGALVRDPDGRVRPPTIAETEARIIELETFNKGQKTVTPKVEENFRKLRTLRTVLDFLQTHQARSTH